MQNSIKKGQVSGNKSLSSYKPLLIDSLKIYLESFKLDKNCLIHPQIN